MHPKSTIKLDYRGDGLGYVLSDEHQPELVIVTGGTYVRTAEPFPLLCCDMADRPVFETAEEAEGKEPL